MKRVTTGHATGVQHEVHGPTSIPRGVRADGPAGPSAVACPRRADARDAARRSRPDDRGDGAADDRRGPRRRLEPVVDRDGLSAGVDGLDAAVGQARRHVRPEAGLPGRHRDLSRRLRPVGPEPVDGRADRLPRAAGDRRWRVDDRRPDDRRRRGRAGRPRSLPGAVRRGVRCDHRARAVGRRAARRQRLVALGLLHQPPGRRCRAAGHGRVPPGDAAPCLARDRLRRRGAGDGRHDLPGADDQPRRDDLRVGLAADREPRCGRRRAARAVRGS